MTPLRDAAQGYLDALKTWNELLAESTAGRPVHAEDGAAARQALLDARLALQRANVQANGFPLAHLSNVGLSLVCQTILAAYAEGVASAPSAKRKVAMVVDQPPAWGSPLSPRGGRT